jgi:putative DNA primase/helicase
VGIRHSDLDAHAHLISLFNGAFNLDTGQFIHDENALRPLYLHKQMHVAYDKDAKCPQWMEFLDKIFLQDQDLIHFVQKILSLSLYGNVSEERLFLAYGSGKNGKTTLYNVMKQLLGCYAVAIPSMLLLQSRNKDQRIEYEVNDSLENARLAIASELPEQCSFDSICLKQLSSRDNINAKKIYNPVYSFRPSHQLHVHANYLPSFNAQDRALLRRILVIPFDYRVPDSETIENYDVILLREASGILNWLIEGWALYKKEKLVVLPARVQEIMQNYTDDCDILNNFIDNCCTRGVDLKCTLKEFYDVFSSQYENRRIQQKTLSKRLQDAGFEVRESSGNKKHIFGLMLSSQQDNSTYMM